MITRFIDKLSIWTLYGIPYCGKGVYQLTATRLLSDRAEKCLFSTERV